MKIWKILTAITLLSLLVGMVVATDVNNLKVPDGWEAINDHTYHEKGSDPGAGSGRNMMIEKWYDGLKDEYYNNISEEHYRVIDNGDNTFDYSDAMNDDYGCFEVVEINGEKYFVIFFNMMESDFDSVNVSTHDLIMEFNKLNNLKPIEV